MPQRKNKKSPKRVKRASPKRVKRASPKRVKRASPKRVKRASPKRVKRASPKRVKRASPKRTRRTSPKRTRRTSPKRKIRSRRLNPGFMDRLFGRRARQIPGGDDQTGLLPQRDYRPAADFYLSDIRRDMAIAQAEANRQEQRLRALRKSQQITSLEIRYREIVRKKIDQRNESGQRSIDAIGLQPMDRRKQVIDRNMNNLKNSLRQQELIIQRRIENNDLITRQDIYNIISRTVEKEKLRLYSIFIV